MIKNEYLEHYTEHGISPVRQDLSDLHGHHLRRRTLYRTLGLLPSSFKGKRVLEVGPGSGHNSLVVAGWNPSRYVLVEPNPTGVSHIRSLFREHQVEEDRIEIVNRRIEEFLPDERYDIILCEGMIPGMSNKKEILAKLDSLLKEGGVLVLTCSDSTSMFFEMMRYFLAYQLTKKIERFEEKIRVAVQAFGSHLDTLAGFSRLKEDWCADGLFGYAHFNYNFSLKSCMEFFQDRYYTFKTSPGIFTDYRWYKELPHEPSLFNQHYLEQFDLRKHNLLHYQVITPDRSKEVNEELAALCRQAMEAIEKGVKQESPGTEERLLEISERLMENLRNTSGKITEAIGEIQGIIKDGDYTVKRISSQCGSFSSAFGRGQQYISLIKAGEPQFHEERTTSADLKKTDQVDVTFFVPCLNEAENIVPTIETILEAVHEAGASYEILVFDDHSTDETVNVVEEYQRQHQELPMKLIQNPVTGGLAHNYVDGAFLGKGKYYCMVGGDNDVPKEWILSILRKLHEVDIIIPCLEYDIRHKFRVMISKFFIRIVNFISGYSLKYYNGAVHLRQNVLRWHSDSYGFGFMAELTVRVLNQGASYVEIPAPLRQKKHEVFSRAFTLLNILSVSHTLFNILVMRIRKVLYKV